MGGIIISLSSLLIGAFIFLLGNGLFGTLLSIRIDLEDLGADLAGYVQSAYFLGFILSTFASQRIIGAVGHIRSFSAFAGLGAAGAILSGLFFDPISLCVFRGLVGFSIAGLFMVIESWLNGETETKWRGRVMSLYMVTTYSALGLGQLFLGVYDPLGVEPFALIGLLFAVSLVPVALTRVKAPPLPERSFMNFARLYRISPMGIIGCFTSGMLMGAFYGLFPITAQRQGGLEVSQVGTLMTVVILFGLCMQWPVGWLSDRTDRRYIVIGCLTAVFISCVGIFLLELFKGPEILWILVGLLFAFAFTVYPLSVAQMNDYIERKDLVAASGGLILAYSLGAATGPAIAGQAVEHLPQGGLILYMATVSALTALFTLYRTFRRAPVPTDQQGGYAAPPPTTAMASALDPRGDEPEEIHAETESSGDVLAREDDSP
ncbi:MAG: MFS transporter [Alphaproteobacteria bacterium]|nr:MFS transporter [Alphaproteobacteria bacterium]